MKPSTPWARKLDRWIRAQGVSIRQVARALGFSYATVVRWRRGDCEPSPRNRREMDALIAGKTRFRKPKQ